MTDKDNGQESPQAELERLRRRVAELEREDRERTEAESALRLQVAALSEQVELLDLAHDTIMVRDMENRILFWNRGAEENYGWSREEAMGQVTHTFLRTVFPAPLQEIDAELLRHGRWEGELGHTRKDGSGLLVASRWVLRYDREGRPVAIMEINNDITLRKRAEEALRRTLEELDQRVQERTSELMAANQLLTEEIGERQRAVQALRAREQEPRLELPARAW